MALYAVHPDQIFAIWNGGLAIHGGIIAGLIVGAILCRIKKIQFFTLADTVIPGLPLGQAIGRWGNFFNQEAYGVQTNLPWAITVRDRRWGILKWPDVFYMNHLGFMYFRIPFNLWASLEEK